MKHNLHQRSQHAFTIVELLVTIAVVSIMMFLVNKLFNDTATAVTTGTQASEILGNSMAINRAIQEDARYMIGPSTTDPGLLVIVTKEVSRAVPMPDPQNAGPLRITETDLRTDQLLFIRTPSNSGTLEPLTPAGSSGFAGDSGVAAEHARIWYGHVDRTDNDGTLSSSDTLVSATDGPNWLGFNWILGRQALLLPSSTTAQAKVNGVDWDSELDDDGSLGYYDGNTWSDKQNYMGLADISRRELYRSNPSGSSQYVIFSDNAENSTPHSDVSNDEPLGLFYNSMPQATYESRAVDMAFSGGRLRTNPYPASGEFYSWEIGQMHPYFAENISEFVVQFAADVNNNGRIDRSRNGGADTSGDIWWYDGTADRRPTVAYDPAVSSPSGDNADYAFVWRHDDRPTPNATDSDWPYLIRIRYRIHDERGRFTSTRNVGGVDERISGQWFEVIIPVNRGS